MGGGIRIPRFWWGWGMDEKSPAGAGLHKVWREIFEQKVSGGIIEVGAKIVNQRWRQGHRPAHSRDIPPYIPLCELGCFPQKKGARERLIYPEEAPALCIQ